MPKPLLNVALLRSLFKSKDYQPYLDEFNGLPLDLASSALKIHNNVLVDYVADSKVEEFTTYLGAGNTWYIRELSNGIKYPTPYPIVDVLTYYKLFGSSSVKVGFKQVTGLEGAYLPVINRYGNKSNLGTAYKTLNYQSITKLIGSVEVLYIKPGLLAIKTNSTAIARL